MLLLEDREITYVGAIRVMEGLNCPFREAGRPIMYFSLKEKKKKENTLFSFYIQLLLAAFDKMDRKEMNSEKNSPNCKQECKEIESIHKFNYLLSRMRPLLNYKTVKMRNALVIRLIQTQLCSKGETTGCLSYLLLPSLKELMCLRRKPNYKCNTS